MHVFSSGLSPEESKPEIEIFKSVADGENVIRIGEDVAQNQLVIPKGTQIRPAEIGGLMALGITSIHVAKKPRIGLISTGDEVIDPSTLADIKLLTNDIEAIYSQNGKRRVNLDPGYITLAKIVLASTKNYSHRIYLGKGIYAELALFYKNHQFIAMPYTYNDYKDQTYLVMFMKVRNLLKRIQGKKAYNL